MHHGKHGELISEKDPDGDPGRLGDSCHNTARTIHLNQLDGNTQFVWNGALYSKDDHRLRELLRRFRTDKGYIRHWDVPEDWKETDTPNDLLIPLLIAFEACHMFDYAEELRDRVKIDDWRCGNSDLANPILIGLIKKSKWALNLSLAVQALLSYNPIRWSDEHNCLTWEPNSSADFLNWAHACWHIDSWAFRLVSHELFMTKIRGYFQPEPNSMWIVSLYARVSVKMRKLL